MQMLTLGTGNPEQHNQCLQVHIKNSIGKKKANSVTTVT